MQIFILTILGNVLTDRSIAASFQKAVDKGVVKVDIRNIRDYTMTNPHDGRCALRPAAPAWLMKPEPIFEAVETIKAELAQKEITDVP